MQHTVPFDIIHRRIYITPASVEIGRMHVNNQRFTAHLLGVNTGRIGEPIMGMNDIELNRTGNHPGYNRVIIYLLHQIIGVTSRKFDTPQIIGFQIIKIRINMAAKIEIFLGIHTIAITLLYIIPTYVSPCDRCIRSSDNMGKSFILVSVWFRYDKCDVYIATLCHAFGQPITGRTQTSQDMRRKLPTEHKRFHR